MFGLEIIVIFVIIWWLVLFLVLPFGIRKDDDVKLGNDPGAPKNPGLKKKIYLTTMIMLDYPFKKLFKLLQDIQLFLVPFISMMLLLGIIMEHLKFTQL